MVSVSGEHVCRVCLIECGWFCGSLDDFFFIDTMAFSLSGITGDLMALKRGEIDFKLPAKQPVLKEGEDRGNLPGTGIQM